MIFFFFLAIFQSSRFVPECGGYALGEAKWVCGEDRVDISRFPLSYKLSDRPVSFRCPGEHKCQTFRSLHSEVGTKICIARGICSLSLSSFFPFFCLSHLWQLNLAEFMNKSTKLITLHFPVTKMLSVQSLGKNECKFHKGSSSCLASFLQTH